MGVTMASTRSVRVQCGAFLWGTPPSPWAPQSLRRALAVLHANHIWHLEIGGGDMMKSLPAASRWHLEPFGGRGKWKGPRLSCSTQSTD